MTVHKFEVVDTGRGTFSVMHIEDGVLKGGDFNWLKEVNAERAMKVYEQHPELHGCTTESELRRHGI